MLAPDVSVQLNSVDHSLVYGFMAHEVCRHLSRFYAVAVYFHLVILASAEDEMAVGLTVSQVAAGIEPLTTSHVGLLDEKAAVQLFGVQIAIGDLTSSDEELSLFSVGDGIKLVVEEIAFNAL